MTLSLLREAVLIHRALRLTVGLESLISMYYGAGGEVVKRERCSDQSV